MDTAPGPLYNGRPFAAGADEVDFVVNLTAVKSQRGDDVAEELQAMRTVTEGRVLKLIFETCYLTDAQKRRLCDLCCDAGVDFVKTSTGFGPCGATVEDVRLMKRQVGDRALVKASGGIGTLADVQAMVSAGAVRIGTSSSVAIMQEFPGETIDAQCGHPQGGSLHADASWQPTFLLDHHHRAGALVEDLL